MRSPPAAGTTARPWRCTNGANIITDSRFCTASASGTAATGMSGVSTNSALGPISLQCAPNASQIALVISVSPIAGTFVNSHGSAVSIEAVSNLLIEFLAPATSISPFSGVGPSTISVSIIALNIKRGGRTNKEAGIPYGIPAKNKSRRPTQPCAGSNPNKTSNQVLCQ